MRKNVRYFASKLQIAIFGFLLFFSIASSLILPVAIVHADNGTAICTSQTNAAQDVGTCINRIYVIALTAGGVIAVFLFVIAGYLYMQGGENSGKAKGIILSAVTGLVILFSAFLFLNTINPDLTSFTGLTLPDITCNGTGQELNKNICEAPKSDITTTGSGSTNTSTTQQQGSITISGSVSEQDNVALHGAITAQITGSSYTWQWKSNGAVIENSDGSPATTADIDTTMDDNKQGSHTDIVTATATDTRAGGQTYNGSQTFTIVFDSDGDATSVTPVGSQTASGQVSADSQAAAKLLLSDGSSLIKLNADSTQCPGNGPLTEVTNISNGILVQADGPGTACAVSKVSLSATMLTALHVLATQGLGITVTALANGHHSSSTDPHYLGLAVDFVPQSASQQTAIVQSLFNSGAVKVGAECNATPEYNALSPTNTTSTVCPYAIGNNFHIHAQWAQ